MFKKWQERRAEKKREKKCVITIYLNSADLKYGGDAARVEQGKQYTVRVSPFCDVKTILAHELGHCVESLLGNPWNGSSYAKVRNDFVADMNVLKDEAAAWRFAAKMFPSIKNRINCAGFSSYVLMFKKGVK